MMKPRALPIVLEVLDDGLRLYRRHLSSFTLIATVSLVALALLALSFMTFVRTEIGTTGGWIFLASVVVMLISYPLVLLAFAALSQTAAAALDHRPLTLPGAFRIRPVRGCGMIVFNILFSIMAAVVTSIISTIISCPLASLSVMGSLALEAVSSSGGTGAAILPFTLLFPISSLWWVIMLGAWLTSIVYALQAFVLEQRPWGEAAGRSLDLIVGRFGQSIMMFVAAGAVFGTLIISYLGSLLTLVSILQLRFDLELPPLAADVVTIVLSVASLVVLLPPLAIWMTLFYRRLSVDRDGLELTRHVTDWRERATTPSA